MNEPQGPQFDLRPEEHDPFPSWDDDRRSWTRWAVLVVAVLLIGGAVAYYFYHRSNQSGAKPEAQGATTAAPSTAPTESTQPSPPAENLPELDASDDWVREHAGGVSTSPQFAKWLAGDDLIRRFVVSILNTSEGVSPRKHLARVAPRTPFTPDIEDGQPMLGPSSYKRYDRLANVVSSIDVDAAANLYRLIRPLLNQAYRELGFPDESFDTAVVRALHRIQSTPALSGPIELKKGVSSYKFSDPSLESLSDLQKQLLRMGPRNRALIEKKFSEIVRRLALEDSQ